MMSDLCITDLFYIVNNILSSNISSIDIKLPSAYTVQCAYRQELKLMKGKALRKHSLHEKTAASVLLKLFISSNE